MRSLLLYQRALAWASRREWRIGSHNPFMVAIRLARGVVDDRLGGLAAEMAFFALISLVPIFVTLGALLGYVERILGPEEVARVQATIVGALALVFSPQVTQDIVTPFVSELLRQERGGVAFGGLVVTLYLASRVFTATIRALDLAYRVPERRGLLQQRLLAMGLAAGFLVAAVVTLALLVVGPLLGTGRAIAERLGLGTAFEILWQISRGPVLVVIVVAFLTLVYRYAPNVRNSLRHCLPGAILGFTVWVVATLALRLYLQIGGEQTQTLLAEDEVVALVGRVIGAVVATILWTYITGFAILLGGALNAQLVREHARRSDGAPAAVEAGRSTDQRASDHG